MMIMMKFKFIDSLRNKRERDKDTVRMTITEMMIFELKKLLVDAEILLTLMNKMMTKMK